MSTSAQERAQSTASTAADQGRHLAGVAQEEASTVASEAATQARSVVNDAVSQVGAQMTEQSKEQKAKLADTLRTFGDDLDSMRSSASPGLAADLTRQVSGYARTVSDHLQSREPGELLDDVRSFARRRPGTFLLGALAAGVVVGRLARGAADGIAAASAFEQAGGTGTGTGTGMGTGTTAVPAAQTPPYPGAPAGAPFVPDPHEIHDTHGHETGATGVPTPGTQMPGTQVPGTQVPGTQAMPGHDLGPLSGDDEAGTTR